MKTKHTEYNTKEPGVMTLDKRKTKDNAPPDLYNVHVFFHLLPHVLVNLSTNSYTPRVITAEGKDLSI
jgi:hypothetical protein